MDKVINIPTLEDNFKRLENCIKAINDQIDYEAFKAYGKYAYMYDKHYYGGKPARIQVRKTLKSCMRVTKVIQKQIQSTTDTSTLYRACKLQIEVLKIQQLMF